MSWSNDLAIIFRGLDKVTRAVATQQQQDVQRLWRNSSMRTAAQNAGVRVEEKLSDVVINKDLVCIK